jgi:hypothetical protein
MTEQNSDALTTSFLDIITCGLGSILLLFFLMVAIKGEMQFDDNSLSEQGQNRHDSPLIILVTGENNQKTIWANGVTEPWQAGGAEFSTVLQYGQGYAVLYARKMPPRDWRLSVGPFDPNASVTVEVISDGQRLLRLSSDKIKEITRQQQGILPLWPLEIAKQ